jgi:class 3 adenylate cyclase
LTSLKRLLDLVLSIGAYPEETESQGARRRIMVAAILLATILTVPTLAGEFQAGYYWSAWGNVAILVVTVAVLMALHWIPRRFALLINSLFTTVFVVQLVQTVVFGGLYGSALVVSFGLIIVFGALVALGVRAGWWWFAGFVASVVFAGAIPNWIDPIYFRADPESDAAVNLIAAGLVTFAAMVYFVRQRDRFQKESDDLLHNILPEQIANRLKGGDATIADSFESASVLFVDVVEFTPLSAGMTPHELVGLLDSLFTTFDGFVEELGLEKIKTVGDAYMVASGVPEIRGDHAEAIADLALQIRDHVSAHDFEGHKLRVRIGINSGPVVAGIIGRHKFSYDLWGDVVNTASRMEAHGVPGTIQVTAATYDLINIKFVCEPRGLISVKGKGEMEAYALVSRRPDV